MAHNLVTAFLTLLPGVKKKGPKKRKSPQARRVEQTEALILGTVPSAAPPVLCSVVPSTVGRFALFSRHRLYAIAHELGLSVPRQVRLLSRKDLASLLLEHLRVVDMRNAPGTVEGLLALGTTRLRFLADLCMTTFDNLDLEDEFYCVGREDLTDEQVAVRMLTAFMRAYGRAQFERRPPRLKSEDLLLVPEPARHRPSAKTVRLLEQHQRHIKRTHEPQRSHNSYSLTRARVGAKFPHSHHKGRIDAVMRCGCQMRISIPVRGFFRIQEYYLNTSCSVHPGGLGWEPLHVRLLKKEPGRKKKQSRDHRARVRPRSFRA